MKSLVSKVFFAFFTAILALSAQNQELIIKLRPEVAVRFTTGGKRQTPAMAGAKAHWLIPDEQLGPKAHDKGLDRIIVADFSASYMFPGLRGSQEQRAETLKSARQMLAQYAEVVELNAPAYPAQANQQPWYLGAIGQIFAPQLPSIATAPSAMTVVVMDSGIQPIPYLAANIDAAQSLSFVSGPALEDKGGSGLSETLGHGTFVAGVINAVTYNGTGINPNVSLISYRVFEPIEAADGSGTIISGTEASVLQAFAKLLDLPGKFIVNASFIVSSGDDPLLSDAIEALKDKAVVIAAAGNLASNQSFNPCGLKLSNLVCVGATDQTNHLANFSTFGTQVSMAAPGVNIVAPGNDGNFYPENGTSMSAPIVAGMAALLLQAAPSLSANQLVQALMDGASFNPLLLGLLAAPRQANLPGSLTAIGRVTQNTQLTVSAIVPIWTDQTQLAWGGWATIYGSNFADGAYTSPNGAYPLPTELGNISVLLDNSPVPLMYAGSGQVNAQLPFASDSSNVSHRLTVEKLDDQGNLVDWHSVDNLSLAVASPGILTDSNGKLVTDTANGQLILFAVGLGPTYPAIAAGTPGTGTERVTMSVRVAADGQYTLATAVASARAAGLYEIRLPLPATPPTSLTVTMSLPGTTGYGWEKTYQMQ